MDYETYVADFETTTEAEDFGKAEVWAAAIVKLGSENVEVYNCLENFMMHLLKKDEDCKIFFTNLKFDGQFIIYYLKEIMKYKEAGYFENEDDINSHKFVSDDKMYNCTYKYLVSDRGVYYSIVVKHHNRIFKFWDSLKLIPLSVKATGEAFKTKHRKLEMEYTGHRPHGKITDDEMAYIKNDVLVVKEALEIFFSEGHDKMTIGANCLFTFKEMFGTKKYKEYFPRLDSFEIPEYYFGSKNADEYIRNGYFGGWCYCAFPGCNFENGITLDVNSLYPSRMHSSSGCRYPVGYPHFWKGGFPAEAMDDDKFYYVRFTASFELKPGKLPCIMQKNFLFAKKNTYLTTSNMYNSFNGTFQPTFLDADGNERPCEIELTLSRIDFEMFYLHYNIYTLKILDGCWFDTDIGMFDEYIDYWMQIKATEKGGKRQIAKLFLNNLYGKLASGTNSGYKLFYIGRDDKTLHSVNIDQNNRIPGHIASGAAVTAYARQYTITAAQLNFYPGGNKGFVYGDTDSLHIYNMRPEEVKGVTLHPTALGAWDHEASWSEGRFLRQKTYAEYTENGLSLTCAGMPERCKNLFIASVDPVKRAEYQSRDNLTRREKRFLKRVRTLNDFKYGLEVPGKLVQRTVRGGVLLHEETFTLKP